MYIFFLLSSFILGKQTCYSGWKVEYTGFLMTSYKGYNGQDYVCMDKDSEPIDNSTKDNNEGLFFSSEDHVWQSKMSSIQESHGNALCCMYNINDIFE